MSIPESWRAAMTCRPLIPTLLLALNLPAAQAEETAQAEDAAATSPSPVIEEVYVLGEVEQPQVIQTQRLVKVAGAGNDPLKAIGSLPGVTFANNNPEPAVRGSSPEDNLYIVDFLPVGYVFHNDGSSILNDNTLDTFNLDSAAFPANYNNANGAIIEASSRDVMDTQQGILDLSLLRAGLFAESGTNTEYGSRGGYFSARQSLFQYYIENFLDDEEFEFTVVPEFYDYQGRYQWQVGNDQISLQMLGARDKAGLLFDEDSDEVKKDPELAGGIDVNQQFHSLGVVWDHQFESGLSSRVGTYNLQQKLRLKLGNSNHINIHSDDLGLRSEFSHAISPEHELGWGLQTEHRTVTSTGVLSLNPCDEYQPDCKLSGGAEEILLQDEFIIRSLNLFISDSWQATEQLTLTPGLLYASDDFTDQRYLEPKLQSSYQATDAWEFHANYGRYHKLPDNLYPYSPSAGNPDLVQPQSTHYELGSQHQLTDLWDINLDVYYKDMKNLVIARPSDDYYPDLNEAEYLQLPRFSNNANGRAFGAELLINKNSGERWDGWMSLAWSRTFRYNQLTDTHFRYSYDQPVILNLVANYQWNEQWTLGLKWRAQSGQLITPVTGATYDDSLGAWDPSYGDLNSQRLPFQHNLDLRAERSIQLLNRPADFYIDLINVYGQNNVVGYDYNADYSDYDEVTGLPTLFSVGLKMYLL